MAEKRMFTQKIIDSDAFLEMPTSAQALYFHLNMRADDDGFVNNPKKITRYVGAAEDDLRLLILKRFIIGFDSGVIVIKHWRMHNTLKSDRYKPTDYQEEFSMLRLKDNKAYTENSLSLESGTDLEPEWNQDGNQVEPQNRIDKNRLDKISKERGRFSPPTVDEVADYCKERGNDIDPQAFVDFYTSKGWRVGRDPMKDWRAAVRTWEVRDAKPKCEFKNDKKINEAQISKIREAFGIEE